MVEHLKIGHFLWFNLTCQWVVSGDMHSRLSRQVTIFVLNRFFYPDNWTALPVNSKNFISFKNKSTTSAQVGFYLFLFIATFKSWCQASGLEPLYGQSPSGIRMVGLAKDKSNGAQLIYELTNITPAGSSQGKQLFGSKGKSSPEKIERTPVWHLVSMMVLWSAVLSQFPSFWMLQRCLLERCHAFCGSCCHACEISINQGCLFS